MEAAVQQHLHSLTLRTLHAHSFNRTSSQAAHTLTDVVARYISLVALTAKQNAEQSGRDGAGVNLWDVVEALSELGVGIEELQEFMTDDGKELQRYAMPKEVPREPVDPDTEVDPNVTAAARRLDSLADIKLAVSDGLQSDLDWGFPIEYRRVPSPLLDTPTTVASSSSAPTSPDLMRLDSPLPISSDLKGKGRAVDVSETTDIDMPSSTPTVQPPLVLPPSPISNPSFTPPASPSHHPNKRARHASWVPPDHVPDFLPPFPGTAIKSQDSNDTVVATQSTTKPANDAAPSRRAPLPLRSSYMSKSSYTKAIPYSKSMVAQRFGDLPDEVGVGNDRAGSSASGAASSNSSKKMQSSLQQLIAAHSMLQSATPPASNGTRLRVAHLLASTGPSKYTAPDTLFASATPPPPRFVPPMPTHPVAIPPPEDQPAPKPSSLLPFPKLGAKTISDHSSTFDDPGMPWLHGNLELFTRELLPEHLHAKITTLNPPPALKLPVPPNSNTTEPEPVLYHKPVPAPWNQSLADADDSLRRKDPKKHPTAAVGRDSTKKLPEANLFATWDWTKKDPEETITHRKDKTKGGTGRGGTGSVPPTPTMNGVKSPVTPFSPAFSMDPPPPPSSGPAGPSLIIKNGNVRKTSFTSGVSPLERLSPMEQTAPRLSLR